MLLRDAAKKGTECSRCLTGDMIFLLWFNSIQMTRMQHDSILSAAVFALNAESACPARGLRVGTMASSSDRPPEEDMSTEVGLAECDQNNVIFDFLVRFSALATCAPARRLASEGKGCEVETLCVLAFNGGKP